MANHFLDLPSEILILIFHFLDLPSLIACIATNRRVKSIIEGSALLQYRLATQAACVEDNPCGDTTISIARRLAALNERQTAFLELVPSSIRTIQMDDFPILDTYALSGGIFVMTESPTKQSLRWISLASIREQAPVWERLELDEHILEFTLAVPEDDLLVVLSSTLSLDVHPPPSDAVLKLRFYEMSTGFAHRNAQDPVIIVPIAVTADPTFEVDICGPKVSLLMQRFDAPGPNRLLVYDWKKGQLQMDLADEHSTAVFLSADSILLTNERGGALELWTIPDVPERIAGPQISLKLPQLPNHHEYILGKVEYNPKGNHALASQRPFYSPLAHSVVILTIDIMRYDVEDDPDSGVCLFIPRRALLEQTSACENHGEERLWAEWGPLISWWFSTSSILLDEWPTIACGQRSVFLTPDRHILLLDFNPYTWKRTLLEQAQRKDSTVVPATGQFDFGLSSKLNSVDEVASLGPLGEQTHSRLGCVAKLSLEPTTWDGVIMNEEWILGIKVYVTFLQRPIDLDNTEYPE
ncbi:F-box domain-containing protein [Mycena venus]|uniref:F-box domain-containing protein n=1 Tax=Mycena venus TaxID=2733690 RepID=A0A8H7CXC1_9AGAR|nr:F-box domain-containing protein [Mycena venus]